MTNHELFQQAFQKVQPSPDCMNRLYALHEQKPRRRLSRAGALVLAAVLVLCLAVSASAAAGMNILGQFRAWSGAVDTWYETDDGERGVQGSIDLDNMKVPAELRDGRLYFTANGENIDITDVISDTQAYTYSFTNEQGTYHLIVGGKPESFGWAEFDQDANGEWVGGSFCGGEVGGSINPPWLQNAKKELGVPWS